MSVRLSSDDATCLFDSVTDTAFGPVFPSQEEAEKFLEWYEAAFPIDIRATWFAGDASIVMERYRRWHEATHHAGQFHPSISDSLTKQSLRDDDTEDMHDMRSEPPSAPIAPHSGFYLVNGKMVHKERGEPIW